VSADNLVGLGVGTLLLLYLIAALLFPERF